MLVRRIPPLPLTRNGKEFLDWEQGMPLHMFLALVCRNSNSSTVNSLEERANRLDKESSIDESLIQIKITDKVILSKRQA